MTKVINLGSDFITVVGGVEHRIPKGVSDLPHDVAMITEQRFAPKVSTYHGGRKHIHRNPPEPTPVIVPAEIESVEDESLIPDPEIPEPEPCAVPVSRRRALTHKK